MGSSIQNPLATVEEFTSQAFDYVICGGGAAGLCVAARLSENPDVTVGVIEAGAYHKDDMFVDVPALFPQMLGKPEWDWCHKTVPQKGTKNFAHHLPRGKMLGGSTGINYMMYVRGSNADYEDWAELTGDPSWGAETMKQYMRKHQTLEPFDESITDRTAFPFVGEHHGNSGPVRTSFNPAGTALPIEDDVIKACDQTCGFNKKPVDPWSGDHIGFFNTLGSVARSGPNKGKRSYSARGYFEPNQDRPNLKVICESLVNKVLLERNKAVGVSFSHGGSTHEVKAKREVIVSGGAVKSPQILELSGIGDPEVLKAAGVECKVENKGVGNNTQDHHVTGTAYYLTPGNLTAEVITLPEVMQQAQKELMENQSGPLTCISGVQGFFPYKLFASENELKDCTQNIKDTPVRNEFHRKQLDQVIKHLESDTSANLQLVFLGTQGDFVNGIEDQSKLWPMKRGPNGEFGLTFAVCNQYPASRGSIHISSSDPTQDPRIDPGYLSHPADKQVMAIALKMANKVSQSSFLKDKISHRTSPDPKYNLDSTAECEDAVESQIIGEYHICGSVAMGDALDSRLRVKGVEGLRVVDASAFPNNVSGNICSSVYALAERGADIIRQDNGDGVLKLL